MDHLQHPVPQVYIFLPVVLGVKVRDEDMHTESLVVEGDDPQTLPSKPVSVEQSERPILLLPLLQLSPMGIPIG